jgi:membrane protein involved in colicin uptake
MPLTGDKGYSNKVTDVGKKAVDVASGATPSGAVVRGGKAAARWALDKYRAYSKARDKKAAAEKAKKAAAEKAANEKRADELYGKGTDIKPPEPKPEVKKPEPKPTGVVEDVASTLENIKKKKQALKDATPN